MCCQRIPQPLAMDVTGGYLIMSSENRQIPLKTRENTPDKEESLHQKQQSLSWMVKQIQRHQLLIQMDMDQYFIQPRIGT